MDAALILMALGVLLLAGMAADEIGHRTRLPRVTLLILCGVAAGPSGVDLLPDAFHRIYDLLSVVALSMVAFLLGGKLSTISLHNSGRTILIVSLVAVGATGVFVAAGLWLVGVPLSLAIVLGALATATDPAATQDVVRQTGARGPFTGILLGIVALDDAWGLIAFALFLIGAQVAVGADTNGVVGQALWEIAGAVALGIAIGVPAAYLTGRLRPGDPTQSEALGVVFLTAGLALWLEVSFLLAGIVTGAVVVNFARHHARPFHEVEHIEWPFMILFFVLAGAKLQFDSLVALGIAGAAFVALRLVARIASGWLGGRLAGMPAAQRRWIGFALVPQAGVALGMALIAGEALPALRDTILTIAIGSTVVFELAGPLLTQLALTRVGEIRIDKVPADRSNPEAD
ncbi:cation:proton antiporter [Polymorphum gilvum]|uniref:Monovalent cation: proton antiporter-2 (CPA2) family transporter n=1 Tax=Polymorphum gilvum (strain LMG 25793 / CGMCC 1.9160 / SL003B-26A1) TaxID=991905 RepID=F2J076_POLGS|nr:cation:proton antiporter [Polymorphum gilvum]ADZ68611.1 Monovalent cation: proton antiporter-2 (CPA2) family transporter [Polymorphum gilvum SL003B-26A1]